MARALKSVPGVTAVAQRAVGFALVSVGERSYGAQVMGVDPQAEPTVSSLADLVVKGHYIAGPGDALLGSVIARNLGVEVGDELVVFGSKLDGSVAALSLHVCGIVESGSAELDRVLVQIQLAAFQDEFGLGDQVHMVVARVSDFEHVDATLPAVDAAIAPLGTTSVALPWQRLMPEVAQTMQLKRASSLVMLSLVAVLVTFSIFNSFMMTVFERTREFGMLLAIGMRPAGIIGVLQIEAAWLALLGAAYRTRGGSRGDDRDAARRHSARRDGGRTRAPLPLARPDLPAAQRRRDVAAPLLMIARHPARGADSGAADPHTRTGRCIASGGLTGAVANCWCNSAGAICGATGAAT